MSTIRPTTEVDPADARRVAVIGAGYVGLPTAATLSHFGHHVVLAERDRVRYDMLVAGEVPIVEAGLGELIDEGTSRGTLRFESDAGRAVSGVDFVFLCVPTPQGDDGSADLSYVEAAAEEIAPHLAPGTVVVNKSTVPVGTALLVERVTGRSDIKVVSNPEFLREGTAVADSLHPDRIVVGADDQRAAASVGELFAPTGAPLIVTDPATAETIKYSSNAFLAIKLSYVNSIAGLCESLGADVRDVILGLGYDRRIGFDYLRPGPGWGGSCLPKDTRALVHIGEEHGFDFSMLRGAIASNDNQMERVFDKARIATGGSLDGATIGVLGLTFKAGTDDRRDSPALTLVRRLISAGALVQAYDPTVGVPEGAATGSDDLAGISVCADAYGTARQAKVLVVATEWDEFRGIDYEKIHSLMSQPAIVDARNLLDPAALRRIGFTYTGVGRP